MTHQTALDIINSIENNIPQNKAVILAKIWDKVTHKIICKMCKISASKMDALHINLKAEMSLELAKFTVFILTKVIHDRTKNKKISNINTKMERKECFDTKGLEIIEQTAINCSISYLKIYKMRWKPKSIAAFAKEKKTKKLKKITPQAVTKNHFIPKSFIKKYWSKEYKIHVFNRNNKSWVSQERSYAQWGFRKKLYSDCLENYFGLLEGDSAKSIEMILNTEPLNQPQQLSLVGLFVIQQLRNPYFIQDLKINMSPTVDSLMKEKKSTDADFMQSVYESLYKNNSFYNQLAHPILWGTWVLIRSKTPKFILPDICCVSNADSFLMPLTPNTCFLSIPPKEKTKSILPYSISDNDTIIKNITGILLQNVKKDFIANEDFNSKDCRAIDTIKLSDISNEISNFIQKQPQQV